MVVHIDTLCDLYFFRASSNVMYESLFKTVFGAEEGSSFETAFDSCESLSLPKLTNVPLPAIVYPNASIFFLTL